MENQNIVVFLKTEIEAELDHIYWLTRHKNRLEASKHYFTIFNYDFVFCFNPFVNRHIKETQKYINNCENQIKQLEITLRHYTQSIEI